jgi:hypothetical protein
MNRIDRDLVVFTIVDIIAVVLTAYTIITNHTVSAAFAGFAVGSSTVGILSTWEERVS